MNTILIGIDPGVNTGFATWDGESLTLDTTTITRAMAKVLVLKEQTDCHIHLSSRMRVVVNGSAMLVVSA